MDTGLNLKNARLDDQKKVMEEYVKKDECPFCEGTQAKTLRPVLEQGDFWTVRRNRWPYKNTKLHLLLISRVHCEKLSELSDAAGRELFQMLRWIEDNFKVRSGGIAMRFGNIRFNGATVAHLHMHFIVPDPKKTKSKEDKIRFKIS